jgi:hypothetical protein
MSAIDAQVLDIGAVLDPMAPEDVRRELQFRQLSGVCWAPPSHVIENGIAWTVDILSNDASIGVDGEYIEPRRCLECVSYMHSESNNICLILVRDDYTFRQIGWDILCNSCPQRCTSGQG